MVGKSASTPIFVPMIARINSGGALTGKMPVDFVSFDAPAQAIFIRYSLLTSREAQILAAVWLRHLRAQHEWGGVWPGVRPVSRSCEVC